jgi:hypothetical protein
MTVLHKGDTPGHPFRGNQYTDSVVGGLKNLSVRVQDAATKHYPQLSSVAKEAIATAVATTVTQFSNADPDADAVKTSLLHMADNMNITVLQAKEQCLALLRAIKKKPIQKNHRPDHDDDDDDEKAIDRAIEGLEKLDVEDVKKKRPNGDGFMSKRRRILTEFSLDKIAAVDRPCQEGALVTLMKSAALSESERIEALTKQFDESVRIIKVWSAAARAAALLARRALRGSRVGARYVRRNRKKIVRGATREVAEGVAQEAGKKGAEEAITRVQAHRAKQKQREREQQRRRRQLNG